jgi:hypothetical protein
MSQVCKVCNSPYRSEVDQLLSRNIPLRSIVDAYPNFSITGVWHHQQSHLLGSVNVSKERIRRTGSEGILKEIKSIKRKANKFYQLGVREKNHNTINMGLKLLLNCSELSLRASTQIKEILSESKQNVELDKLAERLANVPGALAALKGEDNGRTGVEDGVGADEELAEEVSEVG